MSSDNRIRIGDENLTIEEVHALLEEKIEESTKSLNDAVASATSAIDLKMSSFGMQLFDLQGKNQSTQMDVRDLDKRTEEIRQSVNAISSNIENIKSTLSKFDYARESGKKGTFLTFTIFFALVTLLGGIFTAKGYILGFENLDLLRASLAFVIISALSMGVFHSFYAVFDLHDDDNARIAYYIVMAILIVVVLGLSIKVLCG